MKKCVFAGSFDPFTVGHELIARKCLELFDEAIVAVGINSEKKPTFSLDERVSFIKAVFSDEKRITVRTFSGLLVDFMRENDVKFTVRGIRNEKDYAYESNMAKINKGLDERVTTLFLQVDEKFASVSSTAVRLALEDGLPLDGLVPEKEIAPLLSAFRPRRTQTNR